MIIYGIGSKQLKEAPVEKISCVNCEHQSSVVVVYQRYFDLFWIPTFPIGKKIVLTCPNCDHVVKEKNFPEDFKRSSAQLKSSVPTPKYMFSGLAIILAFISYVALGSYIDDQMESDYFNNPQVDDVYAIYDEYETSGYKYYFMKITQIEGDSISFTVNEYGYSAITSELLPEDGFINYEFSYSKDFVREMYSLDEIVAIYRGYDESSGFNRINITDSLFMEDMNYDLDSAENVNLIE